MVHFSGENSAAVSALVAGIEKRGDLFVHDDGRRPFDKGVPKVLNWLVSRNTGLLFEKPVTMRMDLLDQYQNVEMDPTASH
jgi:hypothetical protein